jgi:hypothetical protein
MLPTETFLSALLQAIPSAFTAMRTMTASLKLKASTLRAAPPADAVRLLLLLRAGLRPVVQVVAPVPLVVALPVREDAVPVAALLEPRKRLPLSTWPNLPRR